MLHHARYARLLKRVTRRISQPFASNAYVCEALEQRTLLNGGAPDTSFNKTGVASISFPAGTTGYATDAIVQSDGKTIVVGYTSSAHDDMLIARFNLDGTLDTSFGASHNG